MNARGRVFVLFRSGLGLVFLAAFLSMAVQLRDLAGSRGLLPWADFLARLHQGGGSAPGRFLSFPTLFLWIRGDAALTVVPLLGAAIALLLVVGIGGRIVPLALWFLYLSCVTAARDFFYYQWDNLLLETSFLAIVLPGRGSLFDLARGRPVPEPPPAMAFLVRWILFRLLFESGLSKLAAGQDTWLNLSAMTYYYETAPLPSWGGWLVQQFPLWFHQFSVFFTFLVELPLALLIFLPRRFRLAFFAIHLPFQVSIGLTSNYGFFNLLSIVLSLTVLQDRDLDAALRIARRTMRRMPSDATGEPAPADAAGPGAPRPPWRRVLLLAPVLLLALVVVPASLIEALGYFNPAAVQGSALLSVRSFYAPFRSVNVYHLFPGVVRERIVAEIEGTSDGIRWEPYHLRYAPGDPQDAPPMTYLHNPRLPFHYSFWTLGRGRRDEEYISNLARRLCCEPASVAHLFKDDPFRAIAPLELRIVYYHYRFGRYADLTLGNYWLREPVGAPTRPYTCSCPPGP
jgi:lipase maturation factor 1